MNTASKGRRSFPALAASRTHSKSALECFIWPLLAKSILFDYSRLRFLLTTLGSMSGNHASNWLPDFVRLTAPTHFLKCSDMSSLLTPSQDGQQTPSATKVVCTLGPSSRSVEALVELLEAGMTLARVDLTWGSVDYHKQTLRNLSVAMHKTHILCAVIVDISGRQVLVKMDASIDEYGWETSRTSISIKAGQEVRITPDQSVDASSEVLPVSYPHYAEMCQEGDTFFVGRYLTSGADDSSIYLRVERICGTDVICKAQTSSDLVGLLTVIHARGHGDMGLNMTKLPLLSQRDIEGIRSIAASKLKFHFLALTHTRTGEDMSEARRFLSELSLNHVKILAKIEDAAALCEFEAISDRADGLILSRGNLGLDVAPEKMARVQKAFIAACNLMGKPVVMTRIVDTMTAFPRPTRAEATDVANAVLDGVDAFMLGAETLRGKFPAETVAQVLSIAKVAEQEFDHDAHYENLTAIVQKTQAQEDRSMTPAESVPFLQNAAMRAQRGGQDPSESSGGLQLRPSLSSIPSHHSIASQRSIDSATAAAAGARRRHNLEAVAATAMRTGAKVQAGLIIAVSHSGRMAALIAKYRPSMPVIALIIPRVVRRNNRWVIEGIASAHQTLINRGVIPLLGAPMFGGGSAQLLQQAIDTAASRGLVRPDQHVVCVLSLKSSLTVQVVPAAPGAAAASKPSALTVLKDGDVSNALQHALSGGTGAAGAEDVPTVGSPSRGLGRRSMDVAVVTSAK